MHTRTIDLKQDPVSLDELLALVKQDTLVVLKEGDQEVARLSPPLVEPTPDDVEARVRRFRESARRVGKAAEVDGLTEEEMMATLEETRQRLHEERHGLSGYNR